MPQKPLPPKSSLTMLWLCLGLYLAFNYLSLILNAGIIVDDWGDIAHNLECASFWECYSAWFPLFSNRPLAPLPITALTFALGTWYSGYLLINSLLYLLAIGICAKVIHTLSNRYGAIVFVILAAIPIIAMPVITSPINQSTATVSFLLWSISLLCLMRFVQYGRREDWVWTYGLLILAFLTYEVILPLLVITVLLPWLIPTPAIERAYRLFSPRYFVHFLLPVFGILILVTLWQKGIAPQFMEVDSRLKFSASHALAKTYTFLQVFYRQIPDLFLKLPSYLGWGGALSAVLGLLTLQLAQQFQGLSLTKTSFRFITAALLCFFACALIFVLSNESAVSGGYQARGLSSTWFAFAILMSAFATLIQIPSKIRFFVITTLTTLCALCFSAQREQTSVAWQLQILILQDANRLISKNALEAGATVLGDVPHYLANNYNNEIVFSQPWDFGAALAITNANRIKAGPVIDSSRQELRQLKLFENVVMAQNFSGVTLDNFWVYRFNIKTHSGTLIRIENATQWETFLNELKK